MADNVSYLSHVTSAETIADVDVLAVVDGVVGSDDLAEACGARLRELLGTTAIWFYQPGLLGLVNERINRKEAIRIIDAVTKAVGRDTVVHLGSMLYVPIEDIFGLVEPQFIVAACEDGKLALFAGRRVVDDGGNETYERGHRVKVNDIRRA